MAKLIALDDGHGMATAGKRTPVLPDGQKSIDTGANFMHENEFNRAVVKYLSAHLKRNGFNVLLVAPTDADTSLSARTNLANSKGADLYVSIHANANTGSYGTWGGIETYYYPSADSKKLAGFVQKQLMGGTQLRDRGIKDGSHLWVIRKTNMPAVLLECGYMDNEEEAKLLNSVAYRKECALETAKAICEYYGVKFVSETPAKPKPPVEDSKPALSVKPTPAKPKPKPTAPKPITAPSGTLKYGMKNNAAVKQLQTALNKVHFNCGTPDGDFGKGTLDALKRFQSVYTPYDVDGIYGAKTKAALAKLLK